MRNRQKTFLALASATFLLIANPCAAQKYKVAKVERTRILIDKQWDAQPDAEAAAFIAPYKNKVDSIMGPVVGTLSHDMTRHRPESELSNLLTDILVWGGRDFHEQPVFAVYNMGGIRSNLAKGKDLESAVEQPKAYISGALGAMLDLGHGRGPMNHLFDLKSEYCGEEC